MLDICVVAHTRATLASSAPGHAHVEALGGGGLVDQQDGLVGPASPAGRPRVRACPSERQPSDLLAPLHLGTDQPPGGQGQAKPYQLRQLLRLIERYDLRLEQARTTCRPGHLTQRGREDRRRLEAAEARYDELVDHARRRQAWLDAHADTFAYRDDLAAAVANRRNELRVAAAITQPDHVVNLIGVVPIGDPEATRTWIKRASWIESYRDEWGVEPEQLRSAHSIGARARSGTGRCTRPRSSPGRPSRRWAAASTTAWNRESTWVGDRRIGQPEAPQGSFSSMIHWRCPGPSRVRFAGLRPPLTAPRESRSIRE